MLKWLRKCKNFIMGLSQEKSKAQWCKDLVFKNLKISSEQGQQ